MPLQDTWGPAGCHHVNMPMLVNLEHPGTPVPSARNSHGGLPGETTIVDVGILSPRVLQAWPMAMVGTGVPVVTANSMPSNTPLNGSAIVRAILHSSPPSRQPNTWHMISNNQNDLDMSDIRQNHGKIHSEFRICQFYWSCEYVNSDFLPCC